MATGVRLTDSSLKQGIKARPRVAACQICGSVLSAYNAGPNCYAHTVGIPWKGPGQLPR